MTVINSIADLRALAQRRLPRALYDYIERGSYDELTWTRNRDDFRTIQLRQRVMVDVSGLDTATTVLGESWKMPLAPAPTGLTGLFWRDGEIHAARAARHAGVPFCLSTMSICPIEDVRAGFDGTLWFQLYVMRDRTFTGMLMTRALEARCPVLVVTLDLPLQALRRRDPKNGLAVPPRLTWASARDFVPARLGVRRIAQPPPDLRQPRHFLPPQGHRGALRVDGQPARAADCAGPGLGARALAWQAGIQGHH